MRRNDLKKGTAGLSIHTAQYIKQSEIDNINTVDTHRKVVNITLS